MKVRFFWVIAIALSILGCTHLIINVWQKWDTSPVIVSFAESATSIWEVPFPAVSICPETKCKQNVFNFTDLYHKHADYLAWIDPEGYDVMNVSEDIEPDELFGVEAVALFCDKHVLTSGREIMPYKDTKDFLEKVAPKFSEVILICKWQGKRISNCEEYFRPVWSDAGLCYTFNMLDNREIFTETAVQHGEMNTGRTSGGWDLENGYPAKDQLDTFPMRVLRAGEDTGLIVTLMGSESQLDYLCRGSAQGYKILIHDPTEIPRVGQEFFRTPFNQEVIAAVKPSMMTTSPGLRNYAPHRRQCYFPRERQLRFFQVYTQRNCELECITNYTLSKCGCVQFYMPRDNITHVCGPGKTTCSIAALEKSVRLEVRNNMERQDEGERIGNRKTDCDCIASCISLEYDAEINQADFAWTKLFEANRINMDELEDGLLFSRISLFLKDTQFLTTGRSEHFGQTDFLANCGGLLGLFSGFSFISLIEIVYFLTIRLWCRLVEGSNCRKPLPASQPSILPDPPKHMETRDNERSEEGEMKRVSGEEKLTTIT